MVYQWKSGARIRADAQLAGEMCMKLADEGRLTAKDLLDESRPVDAPLHDEFEWDDGLAAESWREHQARNIINSLLIVPEKSEPVRGFFKIEQAERNYHSVTAILSRKDTAQRLFDNAMRELVAFQRKYHALEQFNEVWQAIANIQAAQ